MGKEVFRITRKSGVGKPTFVTSIQKSASLSLVFITIHTNGSVLPKKLYNVETTAYIDNANGCASQIRLVTRAAVVVAIFVAWTGAAIAEQRQRMLSFEVPARDLPAMRAFTNQIAALSPRADPQEASLLAQCVYSTASRLRQEYGIVGPPSFVTSLFNNFLINSGITKRGLCFQWAEDMLAALDALKLTSLELHWAEARAGTMRENNAIVVTAKGEPFHSGIVVDCWRHSGRVHWSSVAADHFFPWVENSAYTRFVRARWALAIKRQLAFQVRKEAKEKPASSAGFSAKPH
jgi:predicted DCC family thiol-disulfide oxidoreductase YuxK